MVEVRGLRRSYGDFTLKADFEVPDGTLVSILGPSGSGKTTTLRMIAGFERLETGRILVAGKDVTDSDPAARGIGFVFQDFALFPHMNVAANVAYGLSVRHVPAARRRRRVEELLSLVGLSGFGGRNVNTLSGGEQQRVALARALAIDPAVLLLDEPFSSVDTPLRKNLRRQIRSLQRELGLTTVFVTHSQDEAMAISDSIILMRDGEVVQQAAPAALYNRPVDPFAASFMGTANLFTGTVAEEAPDGGAGGRAEQGVGRAGGGGAGGGRGRTWIVESFARLHVAEDAFPEPPQCGREVSVLVRPEKLRFGWGDGEDGDGCEGRRQRDGYANRFAAKVVSRQYFGNHYEYLCTSDAGEITIYDAPERQVGGNVHVGFDPAECVVLLQPGD